jgi:hypothetical protein
MKIKAILGSGRFRIFNVFKFEELKALTTLYKRWEYMS